MERSNDILIRDQSGLTFTFLPQLDYGLLPMYAVQLDADVPDRSMSRIRVSIGVFPTKRTKNTCSITLWFTVRIEGNLSNSLPKRLGCVGYWLRI